MSKGVYPFADLAQEMARVRVFYSRRCKDRRCITEARELGVLSEGVYPFADLVQKMARVGGMLNCCHSEDVRRIAEAFPNPA